MLIPIVTMTATITTPPKNMKKAVSGPFGAGGHGGCLRSPLSLPVADAVLGGSDGSGAVFVFAGGIRYSEGETARAEDLRRGCFRRRGPTEAEPWEEVPPRTLVAGTAQLGVNVAELQLR